MPKIKLADGKEREIYSESSTMFIVDGEVVGSKEFLEKIVNRLIDKHKTNFKGIGQPLRIALTGSKFGPGLYNIILSLDKNEAIKRLKMIK